MIPVATANKSEFIVDFANLHTVFVKWSFDGKSVVWGGAVTFTAPRFFAWVPMEAEGCKICAKQPSTLRDHPVTHCAATGPDLP